MRTALTLLVLVLLAGGAGAEDAAALVAKLGDPASDVRDEAFVTLRKLGKPALPALEAGRMSGDPEVRRTCGELIEQIRADRGPRLEAFLDGIDPVQEPLPGWAAFKERAGTDKVARLAYLDLQQLNPAFLEQLEKNPRQVAGQAAALCTILWNQGRGVPPGESRVGQLLAALVASSLEATLDQNAFNAFNSMLYQQDMRQMLAANSVARRLVTRVLTTRAGADRNQLLQTAYLANNLNLTEYLQGTLVPAAQKMLDELGNHPTDLNRMSQVVQLVQAARLTNALRPRLVPLVRRLAEVAAKSVHDGTAYNDPNALYQASNACQSLGLLDVADEILKPAVRKLIAGVGEKPGDMNRFYQAINLGRTMRLEAELTQFLQPAVARMIADAAQHPDDENSFNNALNMARQLNMQEAIEAVLRPAARQRILALLEKPLDLNRLSTVIYQARNVELGDLIEDTLKPIFTKQATTLLADPDINRIQQFYNLAQSLGGNDLIATVVKPAFVKLLKTMAARPALDPSITNQFHLAKQLGVMPDMLPLARKAALAKELPGYGRGLAILAVIEFGTKDDLAALEPLLKDTTTVGSMGLNSSTVTAEIRDVVLGATLFKSGKSLADYGFPYFKVAPQVRPFDLPGSFLGFGNATERAAAHKKYAEAKQKESKP